MSQAGKLQRWIDLMAALLSRRYGLTLLEIREKVPGYNGENEESVRRTFERDKDELRRLGVPIETRGTDGEAETRYAIGTTQFYLPYLSVVTPRGRAEPKRVDRFGYHSLQSLDLTDDELKLLADAASRVRQLGDPILADEVRLALAKLAVDIPAEHLSPARNVSVVPPSTVAAGPTFALLADAVLRRKSLTFRYHGIERDSNESREVHPYGLAFTMGHWYLHAMDLARGAVRRFHLGRMRDVAVRARASQGEDFVVDKDFVLADHARPVPQWELGDGPAIEAIVRFTSSNGVVRSARTRGHELPGDPDCAVYAVRRVDRFCRWLLGLAGDALPISPPEVVDAWHTLRERTILAVGRTSQ